MSHHPGALQADRAISDDEAREFQFGAMLEPTVTPSTKPAVAEIAKTAAPAVLAPAVAVQPRQPVPVVARLRSVLFAGIGLAALAAGAYYGYDYWTVGRFHVSTDDAYVQADNITIAPKVSGYLSAVLVGDNEAVKAGQVLARIDDRDYKVALDQADADVAAARAAIASKEAAIDAQQSAIESAKATVQVDQANETFAEQENKRYVDLATTGYGSVQNAQQAIARITAAWATIQRDHSALDSAVKQVALLKADLAQSQAMLAHDQAVRAQAQLNLGYSAIVSPVDGVVGNRTLRVGQYVQAGTQLMSVVPTAEAYVVANFKETQLTDVHKGQPVEIEVDMFPGRVYHGHVDSVAPASGQTFALLPPDNATGNFTKIVQRIPVKILLDQNSADSSELRPGMSVTPSIDTKEAANAVRTASNAKD
jgi:membrane fusion protein (multidrug efflux system)